MVIYETIMEQSPDELPLIYYSNGNFFVYHRSDALKLRQKRIVGQLIGCCPKSPHQIVTSGFPYLLNHYAVTVIITNKLANFRKLVNKENYSTEDNNSSFAENLKHLRKSAEEEFINKRLVELEKRNIVPTTNTIGSFDETKMKLIISNSVDPNLSSFKLIDMDAIEVKKLVQVKEVNSFAFSDLYDKGFYISSGSKFGSDFLAYPGDPVRYHAQYSVRAMASKDGSVDMSKLNYNEINSLNRLCHTANKTMLLAIVFRDDKNHSRIKYWTLKTSREFLEANCDNSSFELIDPSEYRSDLMLVKRQKLVRSTGNQSKESN